MKIQPKSIKKSSLNYRVQKQKQTGFSSPATHYSEPTIDLNTVLVKNRNATFYVRAIDDRFAEFDIYIHDVLIIDKSLTPKRNQLYMANVEGEFILLRHAEKLDCEVLVWGVVTYIIKSMV